MRITRLKLQNWRNFQSAEFRLAARAFFIGPNASGKSNLLDALRFVRDIASAGGGGLQAAIQDRGDVAQVRSFSAKQNPNVTIEIEISDANESAWTYTLEFRARSDKSRLPEVVREIVRHGDELVLERPDQEDRLDILRLSQTALEQVNANKGFRPIVDVLSSVRYLHVVPEIVRDPRRSTGSDDPFGGDLIQRINATPANTRKARLKRMEKALQLAVPQMRNLELEVDDRGVPHLRANYQHWRPQGAWQREDRFSDGTLRLLGLIWSLQEKGGPLLLEEPEMSLNAAVVSRLAPMIARATRRSKRQSLITTHSSDLLDDGVDLAEIYLLTPTDHGTIVTPGADLQDVRALVEGGVPIGEAVAPKTRSTGVGRLAQMDLFSA